ncbi:protein kinase family protein [Yinghuangia soli]|uniref:non-specific serine/threonine protein kinase n=1 Tax=Yinghuangia soli TaxID=2908204 RepID=A0AA41Q950_9ACTN|nr:protein kinase family protein [Yinghuangia soli]MCF2533884.1 protein kinase family protein [Yinghuangia soli]
MTDRTAGSVRLMADGPSGSSTVDTGEIAEVDVTDRDNDATASDVTGETVTEDAEARGEVPVAAPEKTAETADTGTDRAAGQDADDDQDGDAAPDGRSGTPSESPAGTGDSGDSGGNADDTATRKLPKAPAESGGSPAAPPAEPLTEPLTKPLAKPAAPARSAADVPHGTRFADRYRLEDKLSSNGKSATWRAVDEKLRRAVGIHIVASGSDHARSVMAAARAAALVGDPRFVQVLDCAEEDGLVYVVKEWLPDADNLASLLATNPLPPHEAYEMVRSVSDAMAVAHRAGLSHLRLDPNNVLRMHTGQYKIVGLSVEAALYGHDTADAARDDTRAIGSLLYACLARRWPEAAKYGLPEAPRNGMKLCTPGQVKAHVHGPLEGVAMRALGYEHKHQPPFETPSDVVAALAAIPAVLPPEPEPPVSAAGADFDDEYTPTAILSRHSFNGGPPPPVRPTVATAPPPALGGGFGRLVKTIVALILLVAVILATWQIADHVNNKREEKPKQPQSSGPANPSTGGTSPSAAPPGVPIQVVDAKELSLDAGGNPASDDPSNARATFDGNPATAWRTKSYDDGPEAKIRKGIGVILDLGSEQDLRNAKIQLGASGDHTTVGLYAAAPNTAGYPGALTGLTELGTQNTTGNQVEFDLQAPVRTRYVLVWLTAMPYQNTDTSKKVYRSGYQNSIAEVAFTS